MQTAKLGTWGRLVSAKRQQGARIAFAPAGESEHSNAAQLASTPFPDPGDIGGILSATIDGKPISVAVNVR